MEKIEIWFKYHPAKPKYKQKAYWVCGIGDGVHDGTYEEAPTKAGAALKFIEAYNSNNYLNLKINRN